MYKQKFFYPELISIRPDIRLFVPYIFQYVMIPFYQVNVQ